MSVVGGMRGRDHMVEGEKRIEAPDLVQPDDFHAETDALREAVHVFEPREFIGIVRQSQPAGWMPADVLPRQRLEAWVQLIAVGMDFRKAVAARNAGALAGGVPG